MKVILQDKEEIYADFIRQYTPNGYEFIWEDHSGVLAHTAGLGKHFLIVDIETMGISIAALKRYLSNKTKHCSVCLMTHHMPSEALSALQSQGLDAFLWKYANLQNLSKGLKSFLAGENVFLPDEQGMRTEPLTPREQHVLALIADGLSTYEIADVVHLSVHTINTYRKSILKKLNARSPSDLIVKAIKKGFIHI